MSVSRIHEYDETIATIPSGIIYHQAKLRHHTNSFKKRNEIVLEHGERDFAYEDLKMNELLIFGATKQKQKLLEKQKKIE